MEHVDEVVLGEDDVLAVPMINLVTDGGVINMCRMFLLVDRSTSQGAGVLHDGRQGHPAPWFKPDSCAMSRPFKVRTMP